jgi:DNA-binding transcriptional LysR family regulator
MTDHASLIILPPLMNRIRALAPNVRVEASVWNDRRYEEVAAGRLDMALSAEAAPPFLETEVLFNVNFVCLAGSAQRIRCRRLTLTQYLQLPHVLIDTWDGQQTMVDRPLAQLGMKRPVVLSMPFFVPALFCNCPHRSDPDGTARVGGDHSCRRGGADDRSAARD